MRTEDEINYKGHCIQIVKCRKTLPDIPTYAYQVFRAFEASKFLGEASTRDLAIRLAQQQINNAITVPRGMHTDR